MSGQCTKQVYVPSISRQRQCRRLAMEGSDVCSIHSEEQVAKRRARSEGIWDNKQKARMAPYEQINRMREQLNACVIALDTLVQRGIADARTMQLAREALDLVKGKP